MPEKMSGEKTESMTGQEQRQRSVVSGAGHKLSITFFTAVSGFFKWIPIHFVCVRLLFCLNGVSRFVFFLRSGYENKNE